MADIGQEFPAEDTTEEVIRIFRFRAAAEQKEDMLERGNGVRVNSRGRRTSDYHHSSRYRGDDEKERGKWERVAEGCVGFAAQPGVKRNDWRGSCKGA